MRRFLLLFSMALVLTIIFHPKPICGLPHTGIDCSHTSPFGWLILQPKLRAVEGKDRLYPLIKDLTFRERFIKPEVGFDFSIALLISIITVIVYVNFKKSVKFVTDKKDTSAISIFVFLICWIIVLIILAIPYYLFGYAGYSYTTNSVFFKPFFGGYE